MKKSEKSPEELEAESLRLHNLRQEISKERIKAVEEMAKLKWTLMSRQQNNFFEMVFLGQILARFAPYFL